MKRWADEIVASAVFGYFLWNIDVYCCPQLTWLKRSIGLPFGMLLELHGWWHVWTGIGAYVFMALVEYLVTLNEQAGSISGGGVEGFVWPVGIVLREMKRNGNKKGE